MLSIKMNKQVLIISICLIILPTACSTINFGGFNNRPTMTPWEINLINDSSCNMPCWENIVPGKTSIFTAEDIITENNLGVTNGSPQKNNDNNRYYLTWRFNDGQTGHMISKPDSNIVEIISLLPQFKSMVLSDFINYFGQPVYISIAECRGGYTYKSDCYALLSFPDDGVIVILNISETHHKSSKFFISPDEYVIGINIVQSGLEAFQISVINFPLMLDTDLVKSIQPWKGYTEYPFIQWWTQE